VALIACLSGRDVVIRLEGGRLNSTTLRVTGFAFLGRPFKDALNVAGFAGDLRVRPGKREARFDVVKTHVAICGRGKHVTVRQRE
jgi:hypothetical protein